MLGSNLCCNAIMVPCDVLDRHLRDANESQLKIYLYLLRNQANGIISVSDLADYFNYSERDVRRALTFWGIDSDTDEQSDNGGKVVTFNKRPSYSAAQLNDFASRDDIKELLFVTEQYIGKKQGMMSSDFIATVLYLYEDLGFSKDRIINLFEYCADNGKTKLYQIEAVAIEWKEEKIDSQNKNSDVKKEIPKEVYEVFKIFGLKLNYREPSDKEIECVVTWVKDYGFGMDVIREACERTIMRLHDPSFEYTNKVLADWYDFGVKNVSDIKAADEEYRRRKEEAAKSAEAGSKKTQSKKASSDKNGKSAKDKGNKFKNFEQRTYDFAQLEKEALWQ